MLVIIRGEKKEEEKLQRSPLASALEASHSSCHPRADNRDFNSLFVSFSDFIFLFTL